MLKTVAIIQARTGSQRLPAKILEPIGGKPMLEHVIRRTAMADSLDGVIVATSDAPSDDRVGAIVAQAAAACNKPVELFRGSEEDVLQRYAAAAEQVGCETVVRITGDCPLIDWTTIGSLHRYFEDQQLDYAGAGVPSGFPRGLDCEIMDVRALYAAAAAATDQPDREHVTRFLYRHPERFRCSTLAAPPALRRPQYRICVDEPADLALVRQIHAVLGLEFPPIDAVIELLDRDPALAAMNAAVQQKHS